MRMLGLVLFAAMIFCNNAIAGELEERAAISHQTLVLLSHENYKALEKMAQEYRTQKSRTPSGLWKLTSFYSGLDTLARTKRKDEAFWSAWKSKTEKWIKEYPQSPTAYVAHGTVMHAYAWYIRGGEFADKVPKEAWQPFHDQLDRTRMFLEKHKSIASADPHWYELMARVAVASEMDRTRFKKLVDEGLRKEPSYYQLYFAAVQYFAPKWHGNKDNIEELANVAVARTRSYEGMGMYTRIYWAAYQIQYGNNLFLETEVVWEKMKRGIDDILKRYPDQWNINNFALFACLAKDKQKAKELLSLIKGTPTLDVWESESAFLRYKAWAYEGRAL